MKKIISIASVFIFSLFQVFAIADTNSVSGVERYAIYIGSNYGGRSREKLLYAGSDAQSFKKTMAEIGGVTDANSRMLFDPTKEDVDKALSQITETILNSSSISKRSEFIFYYSGHSDENCLLLGDTKYDYSQLKAAITAVPSDIHVVILDSCYSGNFIRTKGGQKRKPFLIDDSSVVSGHAYLSSSSDNESSQESDEIESSYFTNAMITGLRGAADTSGDNKVTLNELYSYAFNDTLSKTEASKAGPQHPNYNITLVGSGDLVLSDISEGEAMISLSKEAKGRFIIRDANEKLISEINKVDGQPIFMALPAGQYSVLIVDDYSTKQGTFILEKDQVYVLDQNSLNTIKRKSNRLRGDTSDVDDEFIDDDFDNDEDLDDDFDFGDDEDTETLSADEFIPYRNTHKQTETKEYIEYNSDDFNLKSKSFEPFQLGLVPGFSIVGNDSDSFLFAVGILGSKVFESKCIQISDLVNISTGNISGAQIAGLCNIGTGNIKGAQLSGVFNLSNQVSGAQAAGVFNIGSNIYGAQIGGVFNLSQNISGIQAAGVMNGAHNSLSSQVAGVFNFAENVQGCQVSGVFNLAKKVTGSQIGLINIAEDVNGVTLGLINYVKNGLHDVCMTWDTNDMFDLYYQGGTKRLFTTLGAQINRDRLFDETLDYFTAYIGLGTRFGISDISMNLEVLWKAVIYDTESDDLADIHEEIKNLPWDKKPNACTIPSLRISLNLFDSKYIAGIIGFDFDINVYGWNDYAFMISDHYVNWYFEDFAVSPSLRAGLSFKF